jgi:hypothetical protein
MRQGQNLRCLNKAYDAELPINSVSRNLRSRTDYSTESRLIPHRTLRIRRRNPHSLPLGPLQSGQLHQSHTMDNT